MIDLDLDLAATVTDVTSDVVSDTVVESSTTFADILPKITRFGNFAVCADSLFTTGRAGVNFCYASHPVAKIFFGASFVCGAMGAAASGAALISTVSGVPVSGAVSSLSARYLHRIGKDALYMGKVTNGNITKPAFINFN